MTRPAPPGLLAVVLRLMRSYRLAPPAPRGGRRRSDIEGAAAGIVLSRVPDIAIRPIEAVQIARDLHRTIGMEIPDSAVRHWTSAAAVLATVRVMHEVTHVLRAPRSDRPRKRLHRDAE